MWEKGEREEGGGGKGREFFLTKTHFDAAYFAVQSRLQELLLIQEQATEESWGGEGEPTRILHGLELACELDEAFMFREPVDLEQVPIYCTCVAFPTDLSTIMERLRNGLYRCVCEV